MRGEDVMRRPGGVASGPLGDRPPDLCSPGGELRSWILEPPGAVVEAVEGTYLTVPLVRYIMQDVEPELRRRRPRAGKYLYILDASHVVRYEPAARRLLTDWVISRRHEVARAVVVTSGSHPLVRMGVSIGAALLRTAGVDVEVADSIADVVRAYGLRPHVVAAAASGR